VQQSRLGTDLIQQSGRICRGRRVASRGGGATRCLRVAGGRRRAVLGFACVCVFRARRWQVCAGIGGPTPAVRQRELPRRLSVFVSRPRPSNPSPPEFAAS
jgi:hypothetical protein